MGSQRRANNKRGGTLRAIGTALFLFALWLLMSGIYHPLTVSLGVFSVVVVVVVTRRMDAQDQDRVVMRMSPIASLGYFVWLLAEIAKANWVVTKAILSRQMPINQHLFRTPHCQKTDLGQVIFATSITLTPGTITVETEPGYFLVHAVTYSEDDPAALADMDRRVAAIERAGVF